MKWIITLFAKKKFSSSIFIPWAKKTYSAVSETRTGMKNFYFSSIAFPPNSSFYPSLRQSNYTGMCTDSGQYYTFIGYFSRWMGRENLVQALALGYHLSIATSSFFPMSDSLAFPWWPLNKPWLPLSLSNHGGLEMEERRKSYSITPSPEPFGSKRWTHRTPLPPLSSFFHLS